MARLRGTGKQKPILLLAHSDVVEAKRADWTTNPFELVESADVFLTSYLPQVRRKLKIDVDDIKADLARSGPNSAGCGVSGKAKVPGFTAASRQIAGQPDYFLALFAHPYNVPAETRATLVATDQAGNSRQMTLVYELKNVKYKKSTLTLSDSFIQNKVAPLLAVKKGGAK